MPDGVSGHARGFRMRSAVGDPATIDVVLGGDLDMAAAFQLEPELDRLLAGPGVRTVVLNLADIGFVDSTGLGALLSNQRGGDAVEIELRIVHASASVQPAIGARARHPRAIGGRFAGERGRRRSCQRPHSGTTASTSGVTRRRVRRSRALRRSPLRARRRSARATFALRSGDRLERASRDEGSNRWPGSNRLGRATRVVRLVGHALVLTGTRSPHPAAGAGRGTLRLDCDHADGSG